MSSAIFAAKKLLRKELKEKLRRMSDSQKVKESSAIATKVLGSEQYNTAHNICGQYLFLSVFFLTHTYVVSIYFNLSLHC